MVLDLQNKQQFNTPILFSIVLILGMFIGYKLSDSINKQRRRSTQSERNLNDLIQLITDKYVDSLDANHLYKDGVNGILSNLDPHTVYIPQEELARVNEELEGSFYGIGVEFFILKDTLHISSIMQGGPSEKTQLRPGDKVIKIDNQLIAGKKIEDDSIISLIRGPLNTDVKLTIIHPDKQIDSLNINRSIIPIKSVTTSFKINKETGYILIRMFSENTYEEFKTALTNLKNEGIKNLIIDVRDNPGGYMDAVANIADELIGGEHTLISTKGKNRQEELSSHINGMFETGQVAILINENSASASEILAGVIQDMDRGTLIGRRTYGKGLVQEQFELPDHSAIRITVARYYLPSGRCIQKSYENGKEEYKKDIYNRYTHGELIHQDSNQHKSIKKLFYTADKQIVYSNEGITPDVFVAIDTTINAKLRSFYENRIASDFASIYFYKHNKEFSQYASVENFVSTFSFSPEMNKELDLYYKNYGLNTIGFNDSKSFAKMQHSIKAEFGKLLFHNNGYYATLVQDDAMIEIALKQFAKTN